MNIEEGIEGRFYANERHCNLVYLMKAKVFAH